MSSRRPGALVLTPEQLLVAANPRRLLYIEAFPGSGKTTVSHQRFGLHRFARTTDHRAVVAVSFTRSATEELRSRVSRQWGPSALTWPHRIATLDSVLNDLLTHLLRSRILQWPGGHEELEVLDTWPTHLPTTPTKAKPVLRLAGTRVVTTYQQEEEPKYHIKPVDFSSAIVDGRCTHENVREVLRDALDAEDIRARVTAYFATAIRSLLVDEVYDANDLDVEIIRVAANAGLAVTLVGDPWQALYAFRGARPESVRRLLGLLEFERGELRTTFRWRDSETQTSLTQGLRLGESTILPEGTAKDVNVVLARKWQSLWDCDPQVLPLATAKWRMGPLQKALCTLLLNELTQTTLGLSALFLPEAWTTLGIKEAETLEKLRPNLQSTLQRLAGQDSLAEIWTALVRTVVATGHVEPPEGYKQTTPRKALGHLRTRLNVEHDRLVLGLTCHQAKGREWDRVGVRLEETDVAALRKGLDPSDETHRALYVALTRARHLSVKV
ncbi:MULTISPECIES: UvrD-helicase domain-containing protein [Streptomyces]|uniref:UvrD-helicase domain-containing protein n=1 Tax=Streptomyces TaxID=1883 RepID=UPI00048C3CDD|nr:MULTISPECIES: UvrD-helicase domain-containing protein [unclassified Streptomyces]MYY19349.1 UvrD-helicase domain-containing protein [Streptomyces sp. SID4912]SCE25794.1 DNA helicase-2 / ATP-dependent DNA helicase PcrA [Streptomyces sp. DpondAA-D4]